MAVYHPGCNPEQYDPAWKDEWIGEYTAPTTGPLTTGRRPFDRRVTPARRRSRGVGRSGGSRRRRAGATGGDPWPACGRGSLGPAGAVVGGAGDDALGHAVQQRQRAGDDAAGAVDVLDAGLDHLGVVHDRPHDLGALLEVGGDPGQLRADDEQVERQPGDQQDDVDDGEHDQRGHDRTLSSTRPRNRWCSRPSASTASTPAAVSAISAVSAVLAAACCSVSLISRRPGGRWCAPAGRGS